MVEELLEFSKIEDGRFTLRVEQMDLQAEVEDAIYTYRELFRQDGIDLEYLSAGEMFDRPITGDPERLKQVLCNVLDNGTIMRCGCGTSAPAFRRRSFPM